MLPEALLHRKLHAHDWQFPVQFVGGDRAGFEGVVTVLPDELAKLRLESPRQPLGGRIPGADAPSQSLGSSVPKNDDESNAAEPIEKWSPTTSTSSGGSQSPLIITMAVKKLRQRHRRSENSPQGIRAKTRTKRVSDAGTSLFFECHLI
jgi:hypothetical protein